MCLVEFITRSFRRQQSDVKISLEFLTPDTIPSTTICVSPMLSHFYQQFSQKIQRLAAQKWVVIVLVLVLCVSCAPSEPPDIALKVNVEAGTRPGLYNVSGTTNLPNQNQITVAAIRSLRPTNQDFGAEEKGTYSILDRKSVEVKQGKWQTTLNLWQVAPDGRLQEAWQLGSSQTGLLNPSAEVAFVTTFDPAGQHSLPKQQQVNIQALRGSLVRFSAEGQPYVQAAQSLQVNLPTGRTTPPRLTAEEVNGGWGKRYEISPQPSVASRISTQQFERTQTNAPLSPAEFLR